MKLRLLFLYLTMTQLLSAQELSSIGKSPLLQVDGGLSLNQTYNWSDVANTYSQPYAYTLVANLNLSVYGWAIPLSGMFSNRTWSYQQPFNQFSLNPSYKWLHLYLGYNSMSFSSYTLSGHRFYGAGAEIAPPGNWKFSIMAGRMQERVLPDAAGKIDPAYARFGTGFKTEYTFKGGNVGIATFYARDDKQSLSGYDSLTVTPAENLATSLSGNFSFIKHFTIALEYSTTLITEDMYALSTARYKFMPFFPRKTSTHQYQAYKTNINYNSIVGSFGVGYERVDPGYRTLGAYSTVNDFQNYTFNYSGQVIPEKINFAASLGVENDDLEHTKAQRNNRTVGSLNLGFTPAKTINASLSYGNFRNFTHVRSGFENINSTSPYQYADTLDYTQISETFGGSLTITPAGSENVHRNINLSVNYQQATEEQTDNANQSNNRFITGMFGYSQSMVKQNLSLSSGINFTRNVSDTIVTLMIGPSVSTHKSFFDKKLSASLSLSYNQSLMNSKSQSEVWVARSGISYSLQQRHIFDFSAVYANRHSITKGLRTNDVAITLTYRYNFKGLKFEFRKKAPPENNINP